MAISASSAFIALARQDVATVKAFFGTKGFNAYIFGSENERPRNADIRLPDDLEDDMLAFGKVRFEVFERHGMIRLQNIPPTTLEKTGRGHMSWIAFVCADPHFDTVRIDGDIGLIGSPAQADFRFPFDYVDVHRDIGKNIYIENVIFEFPVSI